MDEVPIPSLRNGGVLVRNQASMISAGTERASVQTAQAGMVGKARSRPDLVWRAMFSESGLRERCPMD